MSDETTPKFDLKSAFIEDNTENAYWLHLACPCRILNHKNGICEAGDFSEHKGKDVSGIKPAETAFAVVGYDAVSDTTLVIARPLTGRTHQIRLHLQFLNHPIANDPNYGGEMFYGDPKGASACSFAKLQLESFDDTCTSSKKSQRPQNAITTDIPASTEEVAQQHELKKQASESLLQYIKRTCVWCARGTGKEEDRAIAEFLIRSPGLWLHALQYQINDTTYRTELPAWALGF